MALLIIVGAGIGIGQSVAKQFGDQGFTIGLIARNKSKLKHLKNELTELNIKAMYAVADVTKKEKLADAITLIELEMGPATLFIYNAFGFHYQNILALDWKTLNNDLAITLGGFIHLMQHVLPKLMEQNQGTIMVTCNNIGADGEPNMTTLSVGMASIRNLVLGFQKQLNGSGVHMGLLTIQKSVNEVDTHYNPTLIGQKFWELYQIVQKEGFYELVY